MLGKIETKAALYAQKILIEAGKVAVVGAQYFVIAHAQGRFAAVRAMCAHGGYIRQLPGPRFVAIGAARESADRTNIDAHAALFAVEVVLPIRDDHRL